MLEMMKIAKFAKCIGGKKIASNDDLSPRISSFLSLNRYHYYYYYYYYYYYSRCNPSSNHRHRHLRGTYFGYQSSSNHYYSGGDTSGPVEKER